MKVICSIMLFCLVLIGLAVQQSHAASSVSSKVDGIVYWKPPVAREDGTKMTTLEIKGYEIRYRKSGTQDAYKVEIAAGGANYRHIIKGLDSANYEVDICTIDTQDVKSVRVPVPQVVAGAPKEPSTVSIRFQLSRS